MGAKSTAALACWSLAGPVRRWAASGSAGAGLAPRSATGASHSIERCVSFAAQPGGQATDSWSHIRMSCHGGELDSPGVEASRVPPCIAILQGSFTAWATQVPAGSSRIAAGRGDDGRRASSSTATDSVSVTSSSSGFTREGQATETAGRPEGAPSAEQGGAEPSIATGAGTPAPADVTGDDSTGSSEAAADAAVAGGVAGRVAPLPEDIVAALPLPSTHAPRGPTRQERRQAAAEARLAEEETGQLPYPRFASLGLALGDAKAPTAAPKAGGKASEADTALPLMDAIKKVKASARAKFDETVEVHVKLGVDPRRSDQTVRGSAVLPRGSGKSSRVAVFAEGGKADEARAAGADIVGGEELIQKIKESGKLEFDKCIATPPLMPKLTQVARILGPKGLMPNPKMGTVTMNVEEAVATAKRGKADFRADRTGNVHCAVGKVSFADEALRENISAVAAALLAAKPQGLKKTSRFQGFFTTLTLCSTMGPGVLTSVSSVAAAVDQYSKSGSVK